MFMSAIKNIVFYGTLLEKNITSMADIIIRIIIKSGIPDLVDFIQYSRGKCFAVNGFYSINKNAGCFFFYSKPVCVRF